MHFWHDEEMTTPVAQLVGRRVRAVRNNQGLSRETLSALSKVSLRTICRVEAGQDCHVTTLHGIASGLGVAVAELMREPE